MTRAVTARAAFWPGRLVDLLALTPADVDWPMIAARLARIPRFLGGTRTDAPPYSVAQHSVAVMDMCPRPVRAYGILHDVKESWMGDLTTPAVEALDACAPSPGHVKTAVYALGARLDSVVYRAAGVRWPSAEILRLVDEADRQALANEMWALCGIDPTEHGLPKPHCPSNFRPLPEAAARDEFLAALQQATGISVRN